jgi:hypothetical protein
MVSSSPHAKASAGTKRRISQMNARLTWVAMLVIVSMLLSACDPVATGSGKLVTESREIRGTVHSIVLNRGEMVLAQGDQESLTIEADDNLIEYVIAENAGGTLTLDMGEVPGVMGAFTTQLRFALTLADLEGITVGWAGDLDVERLEADRLEIEVRGGGTLRIAELDAQELETLITREGTVELAGQVREQTVTLLGSGGYSCGDLRSERASVTVSGSGDVTVWATEALEARVTGDGAVAYYGDPRTEFSNTGSGSIQHLGGK